MYVFPDPRSRGVGRALVSRALDIAGGELGVRSVRPGVNTRNTAAVALYQSMGFQAYGTEIGFLRIGGELHDEYLMSKVVGDT